MKYYLLIFIISICSKANAVMSATDCVSFVKAAYLTRTGLTMSSSNSDLIDLCTGIIKLIQTEAAVQSGIPVSTTGGPSAQTGATTAAGTIQ